MSTVNTWPVKSIILYNNIEGVFYDQKDRQEMLGIFYEAIFSFRGSPFCVSYQYTPPTTTTNTHPWLRNAIWLAFLLHTCILTTDTLISHSQLIWRRDYHDNGFSSWFFYILVCFFCLYSLPVIVVLVMKVLWKNRSDVKWLPIFNILKNFGALN